MGHPNGGGLASGAEAAAVKMLLTWWEMADKMCIVMGSAMAYRMIHLRRRAGGARFLLGLLLRGARVGRSAG